MYMEPLGVRALPRHPVRRIRAPRGAEIFLKEQAEERWELRQHLLHAGVEALGDRAWILSVAPAYVDPTKKLYSGPYGLY